MWKPISEILPSFLQNEGNQRKLAASAICSQATRLLPGQARAVSFHTGRLTINFSNHPALFVFAQEQEEFIEQLNRHLGEAVVRELRLRVEPA